MKRLFLFLFLLIATAAWGASPVTLQGPGNTDPKAIVQTDGSLKTYNSNPSYNQTVGGPLFSLALADGGIDTSGVYPIGDCNKLSFFITFHSGNTAGGGKQRLVFDVQLLDTPSAASADTNYVFNWDPYGCIDGNRGSSPAGADSIGDGTSYNANVSPGTVVVVYDGARRVLAPGGGMSKVFSIGCLNGAKYFRVRVRNASGRTSTFNVLYRGAYQ